MTDLATIIERKGAKSKEYPADWDIIALRIKEIAKWRCERCHADFDPGLNISRKGNGFVLTVHHLDGNKKNCQQYNLAALCQRCHLRIQARVEFLRDTLDGIHSYWMSRHVKGYNVEARLYGKRELTLTEVREKDYSDEWADSPQSQQSHLYALRNFLSHGYTVRTIAGSHELYNETKRNFSANRGAYKLFRRPHLLRLSSLLCRFSFPHLPYCIPATHILRPFVQKVRYVNRICFSEELISTACPWNRKYVPQGIGFVLCVVYAQAKLVHQVYVAFRFSQIINDVWIGFRTFTKVSCRLGKIIVPPCPVLQLRVVKPQREVYWVVGYEDGKLVARQLQGPPAGRSSAELSPDNQPHNAASSFLLYKVIYLSPAS